MALDRDLLRSQVHAAVDGDPWHGPPLVRLVAALSAEQAAARPVPAAHSIWQLVLHVASWQREVARRLRGNVWALPEDGDWPEPGAVTPAAWAAAVAHLDATRRELDAALAAATDADLDRRVGSERNPVLGSGVTLREAVLGILQHDAYHGGQIALLRRALGLPA